MIERIEKLTELTLSGEMYVNPIKTEFDREDLFLSENEMQVKRILKNITVFGYALRDFQIIL